MENYEWWNVHVNVCSSFELYSTKKNTVHGRWCVWICGGEFEFTGKTKLVFNFRLILLKKRGSSSEKKEGKLSSSSHVHVASLKDVFFSSFARRTHVDRRLMTVEAKSDARARGQDETLKIMTRLDRVRLERIQQLQQSCCHPTHSTNSSSLNDDRSSHDAIFWY